MTSARSPKLTFAFLATAILMAVIAALLVATPNGVFAAAPDRPTDLTATAVYHDTVSLTWNHPEPGTVDNYQVLSRRVGSGAGRLVQVGTSRTTSFVHDGLESESTYIYRVKPVNSAGEEGRRSPRAEATTPAEETPDPTPAQPQRSDDEEQDNTARSSHDVLASNTDQTVNTSGSSHFQAQSFETGGDTGGYTITEVQIRLRTVTSGATTTVKIKEDDSGEPGNLVATLTTPATLTSSALNTFTAPAITTLDAGTTYWISVSEGVSNRVTFASTAGDGQTGWSIGNGRLWRASETSNWQSENASLVIVIKGSVGTTTVSDDATLSALTVNDGTNDLTLDPTFVSGTYVYEADVGGAVDEVTLTATVNDDGAEVSGVTLGGAAITDTDFTDGITVTSLVEGDNVIVVTVTAEDTTTQTYTITVTRATGISVIPLAWSLKPLGLTGGDKFRLIFLSSTKRNADPTNIATYDTFIQGLAAAGHDDIQDYSDGFHVVGCTEDTDARDNTETRHSSADRGVPIYWLNGIKVADDYQDFYVGGWDDEIH